MALMQLLDQPEAVVEEAAPVATEESAEPAKKAAPKKKKVSATAKKTSLKKKSSKSAEEKAEKKAKSVKKAEAKAKKVETRAHKKAAPKKKAAAKEKDVEVVRSCLQQRSRATARLFCLSCTRRLVSDRLATVGVLQGLSCTAPFHPALPRSRQYHRACCRSRWRAQRQVQMLSLTGRRCVSLSVR